MKLFRLSLIAATVLAADANWKAAIEPVGTVRCNFPAQVNVKLADAKGAPVEDASVEIILTMKDMDHGEFKTKAKMIKPGVYEAKPTFYMVGKWNVAVKSKRAGASRVDNFPYEVKE